jgi:hypothetical protein
MGELIHRRHIPHGGAGELAEREPDHRVQHPLDSERRDGDPDALLIGSDEIPAA